VNHYFLFILLLCVCLIITCAPDRSSMAFKPLHVINMSPDLPEMGCFNAKCDTDVPPYMEYWYHGYCKEKFLDFAALAVFEGQSCPPPPVKKGKDSLCTSRYRIIRVMYSASDTLKKDYIEVKERPLIPQLRYRPMLIFGNYNNGMIQVKGYEDTREYFLPLTHLQYYPWVLGQTLGNTLVSGRREFSGYDMYTFHSIGTPYYNVGALDSTEKIYYNEYLIPGIEMGVKRAGKDFNELWRRLTQNRTDVKAAPIKNDFATLGIIEDMRIVEDSGQKKMCVLDIGMETILKNKTGADSIAMCKDYVNCPPKNSIVTMCKYGDCLPITSMLKLQYFFGDFKRDTLIMDSFVSTRDIFVFGDTIYDISMGFPYEEFLTYFLPSDLSVNEILANHFRPIPIDRWSPTQRDHLISITTDKIVSVMESQPEQKEFIDAAILKIDSLDRELLEKAKEKQPPPVYNGSWDTYRRFKRYRCRRFSYDSDI